MNQTIRVLAVDDHPILLMGLKALIEVQDDMEWAGGLSSADRLVEQALEARAQVALIDIEMPGLDSFEAIHQLARAAPDVRSIVFSAFVRDTYVDAAAQSGAWGYLSKFDPPEHLLNAIRTVSQGGMVYSASSAHVSEEMAALPHALTGTSGWAPDSVTESKPPPASWQSLTDRELLILRMVGRGLTRAQIAEQLDRSPNTITGHVHSIMKKLKMKDRVELVRFAIREGFAEA